MPGRREKTRCLTDVTVGQFADATEPHDRPAKRATDRRAFLCRVATRASAEEVDEAEPEDEDEEVSDAEATPGAAALVSQSRRRRRRRAVVAAGTGGGTATYPPLLWQLVGGYVHPESVGAFAALCRDARRVTRSRAFWRRLYLRWAWGPAARADEAAPHELRSAAILGCHQGVRPRVIRALHRWHFAEAPAAAIAATPSGLRFQRFAVRGRRLLVLFRRGPPPPPPRPVPDCWEAALAAEEGDGPDQRCPTEGQWLLAADLEDGVCPPACLEELLALDGRFVLAGLRCLTICGGQAKTGGGGGGGRWCELLMRAPHGESRAVGFACGGGGGGGGGAAAVSGASGPRLLPWWRPGFLPALRAAE